MPEDGGSFTGRARRRSTSRAVRYFDLLARSLITFGGIGTIVAVLGVCLFLAWVVFPLFLPASIELQASLIPAGDGAVPVHVGIDEYQNLGWALLADGRVTAFRLDNGEERVSRPLYTDRDLLASSFPIGTDQAVLGFADGTVQIVGVEFETTFLDQDAIPASLASRVDEAVPGDLFDLDDGLVQVTREGQLRYQTLTTTARDAVTLGAGPVRLVAMTERPGGPLVSALVESDAAPVLFLLEGREKEDFLTGETTFVLDAPVELPYRPAGSGSPSFMALSGSGADIFIAWADGTFIRVNCGDPQSAFVAEEGRLTSPGVELTAMSFVLGNTTLAWAGSDGRIEAGFLIRRADVDDDARTPGRPTGQARAILVATKSLASSVSAVLSLAPSGRGRLLLAGDAEGQIRLYNVTSATEIAAVDLESPDPVVRLGMSPKGDGFVAFAGDRFGHWNVDPRYPEANLNALFRPVWYEGYPQPEHTWQSSSGTDDFEPKLGLMPLIFGTVKATVYSMLFGVPLALMAAIFTSEFLHPRGRALIKPTIELMASLPSVVLGFLAALVFAPFVESVLASTLTGFLTVPLSFLLGAYLWQLLPSKTCIRLGRWRFVIHVLLVPVGIWLAILIGPLLESWLFAGDTKAWLNWYPGAPGADRFASSFGGWAVILLPVSAVGAVMAFGRWVDPLLRQWGAGQERLRVAQASLLKFVSISLLTMAIVTIVAAALQGAGFDPRGGLVATYVQRNALVVGFVMGFAVIPIIYTIAEDALSTVPEHLRSASLGTGATQWQTAVRIVVPTAMSGLFSAVMVGLGRAVGETMVVLMAAGNTPVMEWNIFEGFRTLSANIAVELPEAVRNSTHYRTLFLAALVLFAMTFVVNTVAEIVRLRFRKRAYQL